MAIYEVYGHAKVICGMRVKANNKKKLSVSPMKNLEI